MKKICLLMAAAALAAASTGCYVNFSGSSGGWSNADFKVSTNVVKGADVPAGIKNLEVVNAFGAVRITGTDSGAATWSQNLTVHAKTDADVQTLASNLLCKVEVNGDHLKLIVRAPDSHPPGNFTSDMDVTVPKAVAVQCRNQYGRTEIGELIGDVEADSQFGAVALRDIGGKINARTSYAALSANSTGPATLRNQFGAIEAVSIRGALEAETSYAPLNARDVDGQVRLRNQFGQLHAEKTGSADLRTSYGELRVRDIEGDAKIVNQFGRVDVEGVSGAVRAETSYGPMDITGAGENFTCQNQFGGILLRATSTKLSNVEARTSYAALDVRLPSSLKPAVQAHTTYGDTESDFPVLMKPGGQDAFAQVADGTPRVRLENQNGKIRVRAE